ncbi:MAG: hypothetical protein NTZ67_05665 [Gammaproteobacteria bacterium]|nr:hypothetical protein [Gammaproteobacteria bacterium]
MRSEAKKIIEQASGLPALQKLVKTFSAANTKPKIPYSGLEKWIVAAVYFLIKIGNHMDGLIKPQLAELNQKPKPLMEEQVMAILLDELWVQILHPLITLVLMMALSSVVIPHCYYSFFPTRNSNISYLKYDDIFSELKSDVSIMHLPKCTITLGLMTEPCQIEELVKGEWLSLGVEILYEKSELHKWFAQNKRIPHLDKEFDATLYRISPNIAAENEMDKFMKGALEIHLMTKTEIKLV